jgi:hypothetical protein
MLATTPDVTSFPTLRWKVALSWSFVVELRGFEPLILTLPV